MERDRIEVEEAREALHEVAAGRRHAAGRLSSPPWYHPLLGLLLGAVFAAQAAHSTLVVGAVVAGFGGGLALLAEAYRRRTGVWASGYRRGPSGRVSLLLAAVLVALYAAAAAGDYLLGARWSFLAAGIAVVPVVVVLGRRFDETLRAELAGGT